jgi:DinB superfamily
MEIVPDTKDWTWVLERPCPECGFDASGVAGEAVAGRLRDNAAAWELVLAAADVRQRPEPATWSPLEYGCHVRDVFRLYDYRLTLMLTEPDPLYPNWDQDETAVKERYGEQDPAAVAVELVDAADRLASRFETVTGAGWDRPGRRSDGARFTVDSFARYLLHDPVHHLHDATGR